MIENSYANEPSKNHSADDPSKLEVSWENDENLSPVFSHDELLMVAGL
jgi:hypothetical protein